MIVLVKIDDMSGAKDVPYALLYLGDALEKAGYEVKVFHVCDGDLKKVVRFVKNNKPLFVGISVCTGVVTSLSARVSKDIRKVSDVPIVWGGVHPSTLPRQVLSEDYVDYVVIGEGEHTSVELANEISKKKKNLSDVRGIAYKKRGKVVVNEPRPFETDLGKFGIAWHLVDIGSYVKNRCMSYGSERMITYLSSRGCPHRCAFCYNKMFNKNTWRPFPEKRVVDDIEMLKEEYDIDGVFFWDDNFFVDRRRAISIVEKIDLSWHGEIRAGYVNDTLMKKVSRTKCSLLFTGAESGSNRVLKMIKKDMHVDDVVKMNNLCKKYEVPFMCSFVVGFPDEEWSEILSTINFMFRLVKDYPDNPFGHIIGAYIPYPGSDLYDVAITHGFKPPERTEDWDIMYRYSVDFDLPWIDIKKLDALLKGYHTWTSSCVTKTPWRLDLKVMKWLYEARVRNDFFFAPYDIYFHRGLKFSVKRVLRRLGVRLPSQVD